MNKGIAKRAAVVTVALFVLAGSVFADSHKPNWKEGKRGKGFIRTERLMGRSAEIGTAGYAIMGDWVFRGSDKAVKIELDRDGSMEITWHQGLDLKTEWKGFWTATESEISFTVKMKETEIWVNGSQKEVRESMNAVWKIRYSKTDDTLRLTSSDLPKELADLTLYRLSR